MTPSGWAGLILAPFIGSLLGVLIRRLPAGRPVALARSACETCGHVLGPADLVPLASYAANRGRCRHCGAPIGRFHPAVELAAMLVPLCLMAAGVTDPALFWPGCVLGWGLLALGWIDAASFLLPDVVTLPLLLAGLSACAWQQPGELADRALACAVAYIALRLLAWGYRRLRGREGLGQGDAKLLALGGAWTGLAALPDILLVAAVLGLALAGLDALRGRRVTATTRIAFGAPLAAAIWAIYVISLL